MFTVLPRIGTLSLALLLATGGSDLSTANGRDVQTIVQRWTAANRADFEAAAHYNYSERVHDDDGTRTYAVVMLYGSPYRQLVKNNGQPLSADDRRKEADALQKARRERAQESPEDRADRIHEYEKDREHAHRIIEEMPHAFQYTLSATRQAGSRKVYVLSATPRPGYQPQTTEAEVLAGMQGEFWIDTKTFQLVRGSAEVLRPVSIDGFLASVQPGTEFEVEQQPLDSGVWLPTHLLIHSRSSIVFVFHHHTIEDRTYFDYRKVDVVSP